MAHDLVIFDCDGVLVDTERLTAVVESRMLTELGWPNTPEEVVRRFLGRTSEEMLAEVERHLGPETTRLFDERSTVEIHESFDRGLTAVPGVETVLEALAGRGTRMCVASSGSHAKMRKTLGLTGLRRHFDGNIFSADEVEHGKPAPDLFLYAAQQMRTPPDGCAVIEDSVPGIHAAASAGMTAYGFAGGLTSADALEGAGAAVFEDMSGLFDLLTHSSANIA